MKTMRIMLSLFLCLFVTLTTYYFYDQGEVRRDVASETVSVSYLSEELLRKLEDIPEIQFLYNLVEEYDIKSISFSDRTLEVLTNYVKWDLERLEHGKKYDGRYFSYSSLDIFKQGELFELQVNGKPDAIKMLNSALEKRFENVTVLKLNTEPKIDLIGQTVDEDFIQKIIAGGVPTDLSKLKSIDEVLDVVYRHTRFGQPMSDDLIEELDGILESVNFKTLLKNEENASRIALKVEQIISNSFSLKETFRILDQLQLYERATKVTYYHYAYKKLSGLLNKAPLDDFKVGRKKGATAESLGITDLYHTTRSADAFEAIYNTIDGHPNGLMSRKSTTGEAALFGDGFYTFVNKKKDANMSSNYVVHLKLNPNAIEGSDFVYLEDKQYAIVLNRRAVTVEKPKSFVNTVEYIRELIDSNFSGYHDENVEHNIRRRIKNSAHLLTDDQNEFIYKTALEILENKSKRKEGYYILMELLDLRLIPLNEEFLSLLKGYKSVDQFVFLYLTKLEHSQIRDIIGLLLQEETFHQGIQRYIKKWMGAVEKKAIFLNEKAPRKVTIESLLKELSFSGKDCNKIFREFL